MMNSDREVTMEELENWMNGTVSEQMFGNALEHAKHKQRYLFEQTGNEAVMQHWYLVQLTAEYVSSLTLSEYTMTLIKKQSQNGGKRGTNERFSSSRG